MAIKYGFFNSVDGDRKYTAEEIGRYLQGIVSSGVYADSSSSLQVLAGGGMTVTVQPGRAMLHYHYMENDEPLELTLEAGGALPRYDAIVMRLDMENRLCEIAVKQGTPATAPVKPTMTRSDVKKEWALAMVYVDKLAAAVTQTNITDTRPDTGVCGWVTGVIDQVDTADLYKQWQTGYETAWAAFEDWFAHLTETLNVGTYITEYTHTVPLTEDVTTMPLGITDFDPFLDVLFVNVGGILWPATDYTISKGASGYEITFNTAARAGYTVEFRVLKSKIGSVQPDDTAVLLLGDNTGAALTSENGEKAAIGVQADMAQNDPTQPDYIKNRIAYTDGIQTECSFATPPAVTFDALGYTWHKVADVTPSREQLLSSVFTMTTAEDTTHTHVPTPAEIVLQSDELAALMFTDNGMGFVVCYTTGEIAGEFDGVQFVMTVPEAGVYLAYATGVQPPSTWVIGISYTVVHKIDPKYLPEALPTAAAGDEGKFLRIVGGAPAWVSLTDVSQEGA